VRAVCLEKGVVTFFCERHANGLTGQLFCPRCEGVNTTKLALIKLYGDSGRLLQRFSGYYIGSVEKSFKCLLTSLEAKQDFRYAYFEIPRIDRFVWDNHKKVLVDEFSFETRLVVRS